MKVIFSDDLLPEMTADTFDITEDEVVKIVRGSLSEVVHVDESAFIPKVNIILTVYDNFKKSRVIYLTEEAGDISDLGDLTLENLESFSLDTVKLKELRHEDFDSVAEGIETLARIVIDNNKKE